MNLRMNWFASEMEKYFILRFGSELERPADAELCGRARFLALIRYFFPRAHLDLNFIATLHMVKDIVQSCAMVPCHPLI